MNYPRDNVTLYDKPMSIEALEIARFLQEKTALQPHYFHFFSTLNSDAFVIKKTHPTDFCVAFDEGAGTRTDIFQRNFAFIRTNKIHLVINIPQRMLIYPEKRFDLFQPDSFVPEISDIIFKRGTTRFPKSKCLHPAVNVPSDMFSSFYQTGKRLFSEGWLPSVEHGTYGNLSVRSGDSFYMSGRNVDKGNFTPEKLTKIQSVHEFTDFENPHTYADVYYEGSVKPSIDAVIHASIYAKTSAQAIIHIHTEKQFSHLPITAFNYPCGSEGERDSVFPLLAPDTQIIQLYKHGLIVLGHSLDDCLQKTVTLFETAIFLDSFNPSIDEEIYETWLAHAKEAFPEGYADLLVPDFHYVIKRGNEPLAFVYLDESLHRTRFSMYVLPCMPSGQGIGATIFNLITRRSELRGIKRLELITTDACGVEQYYTKKHQFSFVTKQENGLIVLSKNI